MHHFNCLSIWRCKSGCDVQAFKIEAFGILPFLRHSHSENAVFRLKQTALSVVCGFLDVLPPPYQMETRWNILEHSTRVIHERSFYCYVKFSRLKCLNGLPSIFHFPRNGRKHSRTAPAVPSFHHVTLISHNRNQNTIITQHLLIEPMQLSLPRVSSRVFHSAVALNLSLLSSALHGQRCTLARLLVRLSINANFWLLWQIEFVTFDIFSSDCAAHITFRSKTKINCFKLFVDVDDDDYYVILLLASFQTHSFSHLKGIHKFGSNDFTIPFCIEQWKILIFSYQMRCSA